MSKLHDEIKRFKKTGSANLSHMMKIELAATIKTKTGKTININSAAQIREALTILADEFKDTIKEKIHEVVDRVINRLEDMTIKELKQIAKKRGIKGNHKKADLIEILNNGDQPD